MSLKESSREDEINESVENQDNNITSHECNEANQALQAAYLWMKHRTEGMEKRKYTESIIFIITGEGRITGWTAAAAQLVKPRLDNRQTININDFLKITDGRSVQDVVALVILLSLIASGRFVPLNYSAVKCSPSRLPASLWRKRIYFFWSYIPTR